VVTKVSNKPDTYKASGNSQKPGPCKDKTTSEWRRRKELQEVWAGSAWRKQGSVLENAPHGKRPFGRPSLRDGIEEDVVRPGMNWKELWGWIGKCVGEICRTLWC